MPKRSSTPSSDPNIAAFRAVNRLLGRDAEVEVPHKKNPAAVALGRLGGKKGGKARAAKLSPEQRSEIARKAAEARWQDRVGEDDGEGGR